MCRALIQSESKFAALLVLQAMNDARFMKEF
jgi:hypothetical protein